MEKIFKKRMNSAVLYFEVFYLLYIVLRIFEKKYDEAFAVFAVGIFIFLYLLGLRPYKYVINRKILTIHKRIGKPKEINLVACETITDPMPKMTKIITDPHALELYTEGQKRIVLSPKDRVEFVHAVLLANKRINVQVKEYAKNHKAFRKEQKKMRKKAIKKGEIKE